MSRRHLLSLVAVFTLAAALSSLPASAQPKAKANPLATVNWTLGPPAPFNGARFDGGYVAANGRVYFLGFRTDGDATDGSVWYYDVAAGTYTDTGVDMPVPVSNYEVAVLRDRVGVGLYIFGGRDANAQITNATQVYYPGRNIARVVTTDPWPGTTPSGCVSLPAMGVATIQNVAVVMGGAAFAANGCVGDENSAQTWLFNPRAPGGSRWSAGPNLNMARGYITTAVLGKQVYAIGGDVNTSGTLTAQTIVETWRFGSNAWNDGAVADLPIACDESQAFGFASGSFSHGIVLASCGQWPLGTGDTQFYDSGTNTWSAAGAILHVVRNEAGELIQAGGAPVMLLLGGYDDVSQFINPVNVQERASGAFGSAARFRSSPAGAPSRAVPTS